MPPAASVAKPDLMPRLLARAVRWSLPVALLVAALVAMLGLGGLLFGGDAAPGPPTIALDLTRAPAATGVDVPAGASAATPDGPDGACCP